jgi:two-component system sensor kinase FixL
MPWFLGTLAIIAAELGREFVLSRRARLELAELRGRLSQAGRVNLLGQLASAVVHEVIQPINAITINAEAALIHLRQGEKADPAELRAILDDIGRDGRRAVEIIDRMRQFFRRSALALEPLPVEDLVRDVVALVQPEASLRHVALSVQLPPALPRVQGDHVLVSQVLLNLLLNALQAVQSRPADARRIVLAARPDAGTGELEIWVQDSGPGIPDDQADEVFKPFFTTKPQGMGLGLALSRNIIEAHGGRLWFDRAAPAGGVAPGGPGATFRCTLRRV